MSRRTVRVVTSSRSAICWPDQTRRTWRRLSTRSRRAEVSCIGRRPDYRTEVVLYSDYRNALAVQYRQQQIWETRRTTTREAIHVLALRIRDPHARDRGSVGPVVCVHRRQ